MNPPLPAISLILSILALLGALYCFWQVSSLNKMRKTFFAGSKAADLENVIVSLKQRLEDSAQQQAVLEQSLMQLKDSSTFAVQKVGLVRFNPFNDGGGNFSFSLALLDAHNSGVLITSMYGREQNRIYSKQITDGKCDVQLTDEEEQAVISAHNKLPEKANAAKIRQPRKIK